MRIKTPSDVCETAIKIYHEQDLERTRSFLKDWVNDVVFSGGFAYIQDEGVINNWTDENKVSRFTPSITFISRL